jgi:hypothetical protein
MSSKRKQSEDTSPRAAKKAKNSKAEKEDKKAADEIISKEDFLAEAKEIEIIIAGKKYKATAKAFNTGSYGWNTNGKQSFEIDGKEVKCQVGINITVLGSKKKAADDDE